HLLIHIPRKRRSLKMSRPFGIFSGCKLIAPKVTIVEPGARQLARRSALSPPTAFNPNRTGASFIAFFTSSRRFSPSTNTTSPPSKRSSSMNSALHAQGSASNLQTGARVALLGLAINVLLASAKIIAGLLGNAYVLIADGIESTLDIAGSIVIWGGLKFAARPPDATHPYGHGKAEPIAAVVVSMGVLAAALGLAIQSVRALFLPHHAPAPFTLVVLIVAVVVKEVLYRYVIRFGRNVESTAVQTDAWHH